MILNVARLNDVVKNVILQTELQKSRGGHAGITREEGLVVKRSVSANVKHTMPNTGQ